jgi:type IV pilus assembly protein PilZ
MDVNYRHGETYLFSRASNLSELGIFLVSNDPLPKGSRLELQFSSLSGAEPLVVDGEVVWIDHGAHNREPGMGIRFINPSVETQQRIKALIRTLAYLE